MAEREFQPGFRLSVVDVVVLVVGAVASAYAMTVDRFFGIAIAFVVLHFFLFCNVLRMSRSLELIWAGLFAALAIATISFNLLSWPAVFAISGVVTVIVAVIESRRASYHGVGWQKINPRLPEWWQSKATTSGRHLADAGLRLAPVMRFQPRWKEELVCTSQAGAFVLEMPMGVVSVYYPTEQAWAGRAPKWAAPYWREIHQQLQAWCVAQNIPLYVDDTAQVWANAG